MATFIDGIAASENIDSSGERISVAGMDITSLPVDGVFNYEHESKHPDQVVGKVLMAKKIFSEKDCDDDRQKYYWQKCQTPYVYVMGELFDDYKDSAREVAGMFRYDSDKKDQNERNVMNFSIEGAKILKQGIDIVKSIARKVTITVLPCNKAAVAEMVPAKTKKGKDDIDGLFKTETSVEIELFKTEDMGKFLENLKKSATLAKADDPRGTHMGKTTTGKDVFSHERIGNYQGFSSADHKDAANLHYNATTTVGTPQGVQHHMGKMKLHMQAQASAERREKRASSATTSARGTPLTVSKPKPHTSVHRPYGNVGDIKKAMTAGSGMAAPSQLTGGAALAKQCLDPKMHKGCTHGDLQKEEHKHIGWNKLENKLKGEGYSKEESDKIAGSIKAKLNKKEILAERAKEEFKKWGKREEFVKFMSEKNPKMTKTEIELLGGVLALKKSMEDEENLSKVIEFDLTQAIKTIKK